MNLFKKSFFYLCFQAYSGKKVKNLIEFESYVKSAEEVVGRGKFLMWMRPLMSRWRGQWKWTIWISVATKLRRSLKLQRLLSEDPSSSSSSVHFQKPKNLWSFEDLRPKIAKILWENLTIFWTKLSEKFQKYVLFLKLWTLIFPT